MANWPYSTARWQRLRLVKLAASPLCEPCARRGKVTPAQHVDHITAIAAGGDPFPPLEELMSMCPSCHSIKTNAMDRAGGRGVAFKGVGIDGLPLDPDHPFASGRGRKTLSFFPDDLRASKSILTIVSGPPASGKNWYVKLHSKQNDIIIDLDEIGQRIAGGGGHAWDRRWLPDALEERNRMLRALASSAAPKAWFIVSEPTAARRSWWSERLCAAQIIVMETPIEICVARVEQRAATRSFKELTKKAIAKWWSKYSRLRDDIRITPSKDEDRFA